MISVMYADLELRADEYEAALDDFTARADDAFWRRFVARHFTWQRFTEWWIARRFIVPRNPSRR